MSVRDIIQAAAGVGGAPPPPPSNAWDIAFASWQGIRARTVADTVPTDVKLNNNGTKMYALGDTNNALLQYDLSTPYQPSTGVFPSKSVAAEDTVPRGVEFKPDGTKMYVVGDTGNDINEYDLSVAWDVTTASYIQNYAVGSQTTVPEKVRFKDDGTKMYVLGSNTNAVYQYSVSTPWNISTATYDSVSFSVATRAPGPRGMFFGDSGTKMYIASDNNDAVYQYSLSSAWDLSTATFLGILPSGSIAGYETSPNDVKFSSDGTKMYVLGNTTDAVLQYDLSTPYRPSGSFPKSGKNISAQESSPRGVEFKPDGTKMYMIGTQYALVYEYSLSTAWDVTTASVVQNKSVIAQTGQTVQKVRFKDDGTKMYVLSDSNDRVYQYSLSTAWDVSTASYDSVSLNVGIQESNPQGMFFGDSGTKMYIVGFFTDRVYQYTLTSAWDLSTASYANLNFFVGDQETSPSDVFFKSDGTIMYIIGTVGSDANQYALSTAWNVATASFTKVSPVTFGSWVGFSSEGMYIKPDGTQFYVIESSNDSVWQIPMQSAWDVASLVPGLYVNAQEATPTGLAFKDDGTKVYVVGISTDTVYQYSLSTAWNVFTASYDSVSFSVAGQETEPRGITFKADGTKMYIIGSTDDDVNEYNLSIAWDISTASYVQVFSVATQTGAVPQKVEFSSDGTKMVVLSQTNNAVYLYNLSSAWDISTASYSGTSFPIGDGMGETVSTGLAFADSGTKMYMIGQTRDRVSPFVLSSGWDIATANGYFRNIAPQDTAPADVFFKTDGTIMYVLGASSTTRLIHQYALSAAWNISTSSFSKSNPSSFANWYNETDPQGMYINSDGKNFYVVGSNTDSVWQQRMSTDWDMATLYPGFFVGTQEGTPTGVAFKDDGTKMYVVGINNDTVYQYTLSTAWDALTASYEGISFSVAGQETEPRGVTFKTDGTKMYIIGSVGDNINEYTLNTAWNVSTASYVQVFSVSAQTGAIPQKVEFSSDGTKMIVLSQTNNAVYQYNLSSAWNISTASYASVSYPVGTVTGETVSTGLAFADSGTKMYMIGTSTDRVWGFVLGTAWNLATANAYYRTIAAQEDVPRSVTFKPDGTEMYVLGTTGDDVNQYSVSDAWQAQSASFVRVRVVSAQAGALPVKVQFKDDGTKMYVLSNTNDAIYQYSLTSAWNISTATYDAVSFSVTSQEATPEGMFFGDDGNKLYVVGTTADTVFQYNLSTAWNLSTASYSGLSKSVAAQENAPNGVFLGDNGSAMYIVGITNDTVYQYTLSTPWDVSTATYANKSFSVSAYEATPRAIWFRSNGQIFYVVGETNDFVWQFTIS